MSHFRDRVALLCGDPDVDAEDIEQASALVAALGAALPASAPREPGLVVTLTADNGVALEWRIGAVLLTAVLCPDGWWVAGGGANAVGLCAAEAARRLAEMSARALACPDCGGVPCRCDDDRDPWLDAPLTDVERALLEARSREPLFPME